MVLEARHVYWSDNYGKTMVDRFDKMAKLVNDYLGGTDHDKMASVSEIHVHKSNPKKVLLWGDGNVSFYSEDGGDTLTVVDNPKDTLGLSHKIRPHPTQHDWLLSIARTEECYINDKSGCHMDLWLSQDFGKTWKCLTDATDGKLKGALST